MKLNSKRFLDSGASLGKADLEASQLLSILENLPLCLNLWNQRTQNIYCNWHCAKLFGFSSKEEYLNNFFRLFPERQPDGRLSRTASDAYVAQAYEEGSVRFNWMHCKLDGEEIPAEITLFKISVPESKGGDLLVSIIRDLRPQLAGYDDQEHPNDFFYHQLSDRSLFHSIAELSDEWFWVYDISAATIQFFGKGRQILNLSGEKQPFPQYVLDSGLVYPDDLETFMAMSEAAKKGFHHPFDVRFILPNGTPHYFRIVFKTTYNKNGMPLFSIGKTYDIHDQKSLEVLSRTDMLTNCLNKTATETAIKNALDKDKGGFHALYIVDVDNFKAVNDNLGHYFGDLVLKEIASNLHANFRGNDIIGRIGGDEFVVFVQNVVNLDIVSQKAKVITKAFQNTYSGEHADYKISGSIGIALSPKDGDHYEDLYKAADKALYQSKLQGKDRFTFYSDEFVDGTMKTLTLVDNANRMESSYFDTELLSTVFNLMYESQDVHTSLTAVLQLLGRRLKTDRCYIFETFDEGNSYSITFEWCAAGITAQKNNLQNVQTEQLGNFLAELDKSGVLYNNDHDLIENNDTYTLVKGQEIKSFMLVQSKSKKITRLILGLDDCTTARVWSEKEINTLRFVIKMVSIFMAASRHHSLLPKALEKDFSSEEVAVLKKLNEKGIGFYRL